MNLNDVYPHCDPRILHAPKECEFCDKRPDLQKARRDWGIAYTGHKPKEGGLPCPAEVARPIEIIEAWAGNRAVRPVVPEPQVEPVDRTARVTLTGNPPEDPECVGAPAPIDPETGMHKDYWVLSDEERAKGWVRPYRDTYIHRKCGVATTMGRKLSETYARDPKFYGATFCVGCKTHFPVIEFYWDGTTEDVGS